jgi:hypothetical protein
MLTRAGIVPGPRRTASVSAISVKILLWNENGQEEVAAAAQSLGTREIVPVITVE